MTAAEVDSVMPFYEKGATSGGFEAGVRTALEAILASPHFVFRMERERPAAPGQTATRVTDLDLASRLSFFIWGAPPDQELIELAKTGKLTQAAVLEKQAQRLLAELGHGTDRATGLPGRAPFGLVGTSASAS